MAYSVNIYLLLLFSTFSSALLITNNSKEIEYQTTYFRAVENKVMENEVIELNFQTIPASENFGPKNGWYWFEVSINEPVALNELILQIPTHNLGEVFVYRKIWDSLVYLGSNMVSTHQNDFLLEHRFPTFQFHVSDSIETLYLSTHFHKESNFPVRIYTDQEFHQFNSGHQLFTGLYYGFLIAIVLLNLFFFSEHRERVYLLYVIFLCSYSTAIMFQDGIMRTLGLHESIFDLEAASHWLTEITMFIFSFHFLNLNQHVPKFKWIAIALATAMFIAELLYFITAQFLFFVIADSIAMTSFVCTWGITVFKWKKIKYATFYIPAYSLLIALGIHHILAYDFGLFANNGHSLFLKIAGTLDMIVFSYAISYRQRIINKEHDALVSELRILIDSYNDQNKPDPLYQLLEENSLTSHSLTLQEVKVLKCISQGMTNREIADKLYVSYNTIKFHIRNIYRKLQVSGRQEVNEKLMSI